MIRVKNNSQVLYTIGTLLIFLMILMPGSNMGIKIGLFFLFLFLLILKILIKGNRIEYSRKVIVWFGIYVGCGVFYAGLSLFYNNPGALNSFNVKVIEPALIMVIIGALKPNHFGYIINAYILISFFVTVYNIAFFLCINGIVIPPQFQTYFTADFINYGGLNLGLLKFSSQNISWLIYLTPMSITMNLLKNDYSEKKKNLILICAVLGVINAILSMRTAYIICICMTPFLIVVLGKVCNVEYDNQRLKKIIICGGIIVIIMMIAFRKDIAFITVGIMNKITASFSSNDVVNEYGIRDQGGAIRKEQIQDLIYTWIKKPILGWGDSANSLNIIRSEANAGAYEMNYFALLMQRGVVGFCVFWLQIYFIIYESLMIVKKKKLFMSESFSITIGLVTFLFANATNPYLDSFDRLLILFLPLALINMSFKGELANDYNIKNMNSLYITIQREKYKNE